MDNQSNQYKLKYNELKVIGSGNFGSATLISPKSDPTQYLVAKKVLLGKMDDKEKKSAKHEAELLKHLKHPHIVEYVDSYIEDGFFIIVMEYCEEGDLAYHIKKMREKKQNFTEELILNWFLQIVFALGFVHSQKILHRDIKASNIFLTSHGFVKLGDFGISKLLEGTLDSAETVIGTPYYMSPEVCENIPYSYKSDVWALGCVLYELCTLKHAFSANNLLGLVYKIIQDKQDPIPTFYSDKLKNLVATLLTKGHKTRPDIGAILQYDFVKEVAKTFVAKNGELKHNFMPVIKRTEVHLEKELTEMGEVDLVGKTPKEKIEIKRRREAEMKKEMLKQAIKDNRSGVSAAKDRKQREMMSSMDTFAYSKASNSKSGTQTVDVYQSPSRNSSTLMDKSQEFYGDGTIETKYEQTRGGKSKMDQTYNDYPTQTIASMNMDTQNFGKRVGQATNGSQYMSASGTLHQDDRPIRASGQYNIDQMNIAHAGEDTIMGETLNTMEMTSGPMMPKGKRNLNFDKKASPDIELLKTQGAYDMKSNELGYEEYPDDFEDVKSDDEIDDLYEENDPAYRLTQKSGDKELSLVMDEYQRYITKPKEYEMHNSSHFSELPTIRETKNESGTTVGSFGSENRTIGTRTQQLAGKKQQLVDGMGEKLYDEIYQYIAYHKKRDTDQKKIMNYLVSNYGKNLKNSFFGVEEIVFLELGL